MKKEKIVKMDKIDSLIENYSKDLQTLEDIIKNLERNIDLMKKDSSVDKTTLNETKKTYIIFLLRASDYRKMLADLKSLKNN